MGGRGIGDEGYGRRSILPDGRRASGDVQEEEERAFTIGGSHNTIVNVIVVMMMMMVRVGMGVTTL